MYGDTCLTNLTVVISPTCINGGTACTNLSVEFLSQLEQQIEALLAANAISTGYNDRRTFQVMLCLFYLTAQYFNDISLVTDIF